MERLPANKAAKMLLVFSTAAFLAACGGGGGGSSNTSNSGSSSAGNGSASSGSGSGSASNSGGSSTGNSSAPPPGFKYACQPNIGSANPQSVASNAQFTVTNHTVDVANVGKVYNVGANFFSNYWMPAMPVWNYGLPNPIIQVANADGSLDVAWLDYANASDSPAASGLATLGNINITHINPDLNSGCTGSTGIKTYRLLGFTKDTTGNFYLAYNVDSPFKTSTKGDFNNTNGNELHITKAASADFSKPLWDTLVFGNVDNNTLYSAGNPGEAGSGVLGYDPTNNVVVSYLSHEELWSTDQPLVRHQGGIFRLLDANQGSVLQAGSGGNYAMGTGWFYSHNFNQRLIIDNGTYYTLAHGDAYSRQLGFSAFNKTSYTNDTTVFDQSYWTIPGQEGNNTTNAETGQFIKYNSNSFAIIHTTSDTRSARDVRIVLADSSKGTTNSQAWITSNAANQQAIMPKLGMLQNNLFVTYGVWNSTDSSNHTINWYGQTVDQNLNPIGQPQALNNVEFVTDLPMFTFPGGPNAGAVGWVSGNANGTLSVNVVQAPGASSAAKRATLTH